MGTGDSLTLAAHCLTDDVRFNQPHDVPVAVERVQKRLSKKLEKKGITIAWQDTPGTCQLWLFFVEVDRGNQFLRWLLPFSAPAVVKFRMALTTGQSPPEDAMYEGSAQLGLVGGFASSMIRVAADRAANKAAKTVSRWVARQMAEAFRARSV